MDEKQLKENQFANTIPDEELDQVNGGMNIIVIKEKSKILDKIKELIFKIKKKPKDRRSNGGSDQNTD